MSEPKSTTEPDPELLSRWRLAESIFRHRPPSQAAADLAMLALLGLPISDILRWTATGPPRPPDGG